MAYSGDPAISVEQNLLEECLSVEEVIDRTKLTGSNKVSDRSLTGR